MAVVDPPVRRRQLKRRAVCRGVLMHVQIDTKIDPDALPFVSQLVGKRRTSSTTAFGLDTSTVLGPCLS